ncbi:MAG: hypothetical protein LUD22_00755 [Coprobacillus sp.]|nr:hypothetical protein [Coprobacillus sp.]
MYSLILVVGIIAIVFFIVSLIAHTYTYQTTTKTKYSFLNRFPYELNDSFDPRKNITGNLTITFALLLEVVFYLSMISTFNFSSGYLWFTAIGGILVAIFSFFLYFLPFRYLNAHIGLATGSFVIILAIAVSLSLNTGFYLTDYMNFMIDNSYTAEFWDCVISIVISIVVGLILLIILFYTLTKKNPFKLQEIVHDDGTKEYVRPKYFAFALMEWSSIFASFILIISVILYLYGAPSYLSL